MEDQLVSFETIHLARTKGFNLKSDSIVKICWSQSVYATTKEPFSPSCFLNGYYFEYEYDSDYFKNLFKDDKTYRVEVYLPTQSLLQKWLR